MKPLKSEAENMKEAMFTVLRIALGYGVYLGDDLRNILGYSVLQIGVRTPTTGIPVVNVPSEVAVTVEQRVLIVQILHPRPRDLAPWIFP